MAAKKKVTRKATTKKKATRKKATSRRQPVEQTAGSYQYDNEAVQRPDVGLQGEFSGVREPKRYRYDSSLDPQLAWDENREREMAEWLLGLIALAVNEGDVSVFAEPQVWQGDGTRVESLAGAVKLLQALSKPFLNWSGKAERHEINVPTLPLFVHERHSTKAILDTIKHRKATGENLDLFGDKPTDIADRLDAYEHKGPWANRMILGDSLQVMNSLLEYEGLGGQVQMIYMDPPYGVEFGSNFQPFVRKRDVTHGKDEEMIREPEMVKAYRDTWELGLHSYLTYLRDRFLLARELLTDSGSIFVQISDENLPYVRQLIQEVFGAENYLVTIPVKKKGSQKGGLLDPVNDYLVWATKDKEHIRGKYKQLFEESPLDTELVETFRYIELPDGREITFTQLEKELGKPKRYYRDAPEKYYKTFLRRVFLLLKI